MTIKEALLSVNTYPIPDSTIEKIGIDRGLGIDAAYTLIIGASQAYQLGTADTYLWLHGAPSIVEQEVGINSAIAIKQDLLDMANKIYDLYNDAKFSGGTIGFVGENYNG